MSPKSFSVKLAGLIVLSLCSLFMASTLQAQQCQTATPVWADEFNGNSLDTSKWETMIGDGCDLGICGWGNNELQSYQADNATVANGLLTITAKKQRVRAKAYTSARLRTANMPNGGQWTNGRFEARLKLPDGTGMWPAFWMLPTDPAESWPISGEIDILEATGQADMIAFGTIHYGQLFPDNEFTGGRILKQPDAWSDGFHTYAIEWEPNEMRWYVDDLLYSVKTPADLSDSAFWTFENYQYHFLLNIAVGGNIGGAVDESMLPQTMDVDYVRVYDFSQPSLTGDHLVEPSSTATYSVIDEVGTNSIYNWTVPAGATITSGANTSSIIVDWGTAGGDVSVDITNSCGARNIAVSVYVLPTLVQEFVHDDFEGNRNLVYTANTGIFNQAASNPGSDAVNSSLLVAHYTRNSAELFDVIAANTSAVPDANPYVVGDKALLVDVYSTAPIGTEILLQLENSAVATPSNYPSGRHSKYVAHTGTQNAWERLKFQMEDRIDGATADTVVDSFVILFDPNALTGDTYYWDNFDTYGAGSSGPNTPPVASYSNSCSNLSCDFDGSASTDSDGSISSYAWDFGDGNSGSGANVNHIFAASGDYTVNLTVTDNEGATDTNSSLVTVSGGGGVATSMSVSAVLTGTQSAGRGQKLASATVTIVDDLGNAVSDATVTGDFSGTIVENAVSGITVVDGTVQILSSSTAGGKVSVSFCVVNVTHASLSFDTTNSSDLCP